MKSPIISVIIPVYNVEAFLHRCVDSVTSQTFHDIEILLIDDGSTDSSGQLCDALALTDSRIHVFHKENGGAGDARNTGIDHALGEYLIFFDSDDYVDEDMLRWFKLGNAPIHRINANKAGLDKLRSHPYMNFYQAKVIIEYRRKKGKLKSLSQLSLYEEFTEKDLERLSHYLAFD